MTGASVRGCARKAQATAHRTHVTVCTLCMRSSPSPSPTGGSSGVYHENFFYSYSIRIGLCLRGARSSIGFAVFGERMAWRPMAIRRRDQLFGLPDVAVRDRLASIASSGSAMDRSAWAIFAVSDRGAVDHWSAG